MPPLAPRIVEKGLASDRVVVETWSPNTPIICRSNRQAAILEREAGLEIGGRRWTVGERRGDMLQPVVAACDRICARVIPASGPKRLCRCKCTISGARITRRTYGNTASREGRRYSSFGMERGREGPQKFLGQWEGILQTDGISGLRYNRVAEVSACRLLGTRSA